jgi:hypothetical protein
MFHAMNAQFDSSMVCQGVAVAGVTRNRHQEEKCKLVHGYG